MHTQSWPPAKRIVPPHVTATPPATLITLRMSGHAGASGYDRLQEFMGSELIRLSDQWTLGRRIMTRSLRFMIKRSGSLWYQRANLVSELQAARQWLARKGQVFHYLYGENSYRYLGGMKSVRPGNAIVSTYHTPPDRFRQVVTNHRHIARLDGVIVMSTVQLELFTDLLGGERAFFIPHGIDVDYYTPGATPRTRDRIFRCLFVGSHLRDIDTLVAAAKALQPRRDIRFTVVTRPANLPKFEGLDNIDIRSNLDDRQLLSMYQESDLFVMPLLDSTANNSLLEAMACGMPMVTTDLQGVRDYVAPECAVLTKKGDARAVSAAIEWLERDEGARERMGRASRDRALAFRWESIAEHTRDVYRFAGLNLAAG
ncbi:MAG: glycosyltransferase family 4 protein [Gammaproteobacteria bacterium]|nr:glycosyltransferase family 4 protein [Gammaproteobacteria bacterium]